MRGRAATTAAAVLALLHVPAVAGGDDAGRDPLLEVRDAFAELDANGDGFLSREELPVPDAYSRGDADGDGRLTHAELVAACLALADGKGDPPPVPGEKRRGDAKPPAATADGADGRLTEERLKRIFTTDPRFDAESRSREVFATFDRDPKDGRIERKEYPGADGDQVFRRYDRNGDGFLDAREVLPLVKRQIEDLARSRKNPDRARFHYLFDLDHDRVVTRAEYAVLRGPASYFTAYDADGDGRVTVEEAIYPERFRRDRKGGREEAPGATTRTPWDLYDKDGDRRVTRDEFGGGEAVFRRLDRNRDGVLTLQDA